MFQPRISQEYLVNAIQWKKMIDELFPTLRKKKHVRWRDSQLADIKTVPCLVPEEEQHRLRKVPQRFPASDQSPVPVMYSTSSSTSSSSSDNETVEQYINQSNANMLRKSKERQKAIVSHQKLTKNEPGFFSSTWTSIKTTVSSWFTRKNQKE